MAKAIREIKVITKDGTVKKVVPIGANAENIIFDDNETLTVKQENIKSLIQALQEKDVELQEQTDDLKAEDITIKNTITTVKSQLDAADVLLQSNINTLTTNLESVTTKHSELSNSIEDLETENLNIQGQIDELNDDLTITTKTVEKQESITLTDSAERFIENFKVNGNTMTQAEEPSVAAKIDVNYINDTYTIVVTNGNKIQTFYLNCSTNPLFSEEDYYYKDGKNWYVSNQWIKYDLTGNEDWYSKMALNGDLYFALQKGDTAIGEENKDKIFSNCYVYKEVSGDADIGIQLSENSHEIYIKDTNNFKTVDGLKEFLKNENVYIICKTSTTINSLITDSTLISQLDSLQNMMTYLNDTRISSSSESSVKPLLSITYYKNTALYEAIIPVLEKVISLYGE